jgi:hypothetical protein
VIHSMVLTQAFQVVLSEKFNETFLLINDVRGFVQVRHSVRSNTNFRIVLQGISLKKEKFFVNFGFNKIFPKHCISFHIQSLFLI